MTIQIADTCYYNNKEYDIYDHSKSLFDPTIFGIKLTAFTTACYRGHFCKYTILDDHLLLNKLTVNLDTSKCIRKKHTNTRYNKNKPVKINIDFKLTDDEKEAVIASNKLPIINGVTPRYDVQSCLPFAVYENLQFKTKFTGNIKIGADIVNNISDMGGPYLQPHHYKKTLELVFEKGKLKNVIDHSQKKSVLRKIFRKNLATEISHYLGNNDYV